MKVRSRQIPRKSFASFMDNMPIAVVDVVLFNRKKTKTLLFKRNNKPLKGVPFSLGGRLFKNEKIIDCAVRQAQREAGLKIEKNKLFGGFINEEIHRNSVFSGVNYHDIVIYFGYIIDENTEIVLDNQHNEFKWFLVNNKNIHPLMKMRVKKLLNE